MFESRVLRKMCGAKELTVTGIWKELHNGELHDLCFSPNIIRVIKSSGMRWAGHVACMVKEMHAGWGT